MRPAFTIIELLVAIAVLTIGVLALAATAGLVASHVGDGARLTAAAHAARSTMDSLSSRPCSELVGGSAASRGVRVQWVVVRESLVARVEVSVAAALRRRGQSNTYRVLVPCASD